MLGPCQNPSLSQNGSIRSRAPKQVGPLSERRSCPWTKQHPPWRGSLLPLGRVAAPLFFGGPAAQSSGSKLPRHGFCVFWSDPH
ncbi:hypothetical protein DZG01_12685 [Pseudomonas fluorescens]|nr:hypothetical protein DZG01_12685 [Pseudomonas fluorescens]